MSGSSSTSSLLTTLVVLIAAVPATKGEPDSSLSPEVVQAPADAIESRIRDWFHELAAAPAQQRSLAALELGSSLEISVADTAGRRTDDVAIWLEELRPSSARVEYAIDSIRITLEPGGLYRARFEVERRAHFADRSIHVARFDQTWRLRFSADGVPSVVQIDQRLALPFPGTGPRIVCD